MNFSIKNIFKKIATFKKGIHPPSSKGTASMPIKTFPMTEMVYIPLTQHIGQPTECIVEEGEQVFCGTLIGVAKAFVCSNVFSSVSGVVMGTEYRRNATGGKVMHIIIKNDFKYDKVFLPKLSDLSAESLKKRLQDAGVVGMGGATFPTHIKLAPSKPVDTLIINGAECEPYITCDHRLMLERGEEIIKGACFMKEALGVQKVYIAIENNKQDAIANLTSIAEGRVEVIALKTKYPQGAEKQIIYAVTKRKVPCGGLPMDVGCVVNNVSTAYASFLAVAENTPLYERAMTVDGGAVGVAGNFWIGNGVAYKDIYDYCRGEVSQDECFKIISGGPMMGFAQAGLDAVTTKGTSSILFLKKQEVNTDAPSACINCAKCATACPMNLLPMHIFSHTAINDAAGAKKYNAMDCIECGSCAYVCPAKLPLVQTIRLAKVGIKKRELEQAKEKQADEAKAKALADEAKGAESAAQALKETINTGLENQKTKSDENKNIKEEASK